MYLSTFHISKMDCPSEEQMIRMSLEGQSEIVELKFDITARTLQVIHKGDIDRIHRRLDTLQFGTTLVSNVVLENYENESQKSSQDRRLLWQVLGINFFFFLLELTTGFIALSMGLIADSFDMLADSIIYALALFAVGGGMARKKKIALLAGYFQLGIAALGLIEVIRRFLSSSSTPGYQTMILISFLALIGNAWCLYLLQKSKSKEAHMQASMIFTSNDVIVNIGVIIAGALVYFTHSKYPDLIIGSLVFVLVSRGALSILKLAK